MSKTNSSLLLTEANNVDFNGSITKLPSINHLRDPTLPFMSMAYANLQGSDFPRVINNFIHEKLPFLYV